MKVVRFLAAGALATAVWPRPARADNSDLEALLNESVVTAASDTAEVARDAPATSTVITSDALRKYGIRTLGEALDLLALGTMSGNTGTGTTPDMGARGVTIASSAAKHFLLLLDGARVNDIVNGSAVLSRVSGIPIEIVDHIEVILGPGSVLYGSNAMLGVISIVTKDAKNFSGARVGVESELGTSIRPWAGLGESFSLFGVQGQATSEIEYFKQWGPSLYAQPAYGGVDPSTGKPYRYIFAPTGTGTWGGADTNDLSQFEGADIAGHLGVGKFHLSYDAMLNRSPVNIDLESFDRGSHLVGRRLMLDLAYDNRLTSVVSLRTHAYLNASDTETTVYSSWPPNCPDPTINCRSDGRLEAIVGGAEITPSFDWFHDGTFVTLIGGDAERRSGRSILNEFNDATNQPVLLSSGLFDLQDIALAAYAQQQWDPVHWLGINVAGRLEDDPRFSPVFSPRMAVRIDPWKGGTMKLIYSQAFRAPSFYESYFNYPLQPPASGLRAEYERSFEGSIEQAFGAQRLMFGAFATHWTDLIEQYHFTNQEAAAYVKEGLALLPPSLIERNLSSIDTWGFNAAFEGAQLSNALQYGINLTAALAFEHEPTGPTTLLPVSPRAFGNAHISYDLPGDWPTLALAASAESARPFEGAFTSGFSPIPYSPPQCIVHATVSGPFPGVRGLSYRLTGFYAAADREPYRFGPPVGPSPQTPTPSFVPIDRARAVASLTYEF